MLVQCIQSRHTIKIQRSVQTYMKNYLQTVGSSQDPAFVDERAPAECDIEEADAHVPRPRERNRFEASDDLEIGSSRWQGWHVRHKRSRRRQKTAAAGATVAARPRHEWLDARNAARL